MGQSCRTLRRLRRLLADTHTESVLSLSAGLITQELHAALELDALTLLQRRRPRMNRGPSTRPGGSFPPLGGGCASIRRKAVLHLMESSPHRRGARDHLCDHLGSSRQSTGFPAPQANHRGWTRSDGHRPFREVLPTAYGSRQTAEAGDPVDDCLRTTLRHCSRKLWLPAPQRPYARRIRPDQRGGLISSPCGAADQRTDGARTSFSGHADERLHPRVRRFWRSCCRTAIAASTLLAHRLRGPEGGYPTCTGDGNTIDREPCDPRPVRLLQRDTA